MARRHHSHGYLLGGQGQLSAPAAQAAISVRDCLAAQGFAYLDLTEVAENEARAEIKRLDPHVVFFSNPHRLVPQHPQEGLYHHRLSCYESHEAMGYGDNHEQRNQDSKNAFWKILVPHDVSRRFCARTRIRGDAGLSVTG